MAFAAYPSSVVYNIPGKKLKKNAVQHLLWGDWLKPLGPIQGEWVEVRARGETGWMHRDDIQEDRLLEVNFVDIGQGDGCLIVTPEDKFIIIDAGEGDNMYRFLRWHFGGFKKKFTFESAIITHPDKDHYGGFEPLFEAGNVYFGTIFHNGIVERNEKETLGPRTKTGRPRYLVDVISDREALQTIIGNPEKTGKEVLSQPAQNCVRQRKGWRHPNAVRGGRVRAGLRSGKGTQHACLGPVPEKGPAGERRLRWFGSVGETKNGHSVIVQVRYGLVTLMLGGDLNSASEKYLLEHYTGLDPEPKSALEEEMLVRAARQPSHRTSPKPATTAAGTSASSTCKPSMWRLRWFPAVTMNPTVIRGPMPWVHWASTDVDCGR